MKKSDNFADKHRGLLNRRPRKTLGFVTPTEAFFGKSLGENFALQGCIRQSGWSGSLRDCAGYILRVQLERMVMKR